MDTELELFYWVKEGKELRIKDVNSLNLEWYKPNKKTPFRAIAYLGNGKVNVVDDDTHTIIRNVEGNLFTSICEVVNPYMEYGAYLVTQFLNQIDVNFEELEHDEQFSMGKRIYSNFLKSDFNKEEYSEYDCLSKYLDSLKK